MRLDCLVIVFMGIGCVVDPPPSTVVRPAGMGPEASWSPWEAVPRPSPRRFAKVVETPIGVLIVGGVGPSGGMGDAWRWDGAVWSPLPTAGSPLPRLGASAVWCDDRLCVWGGTAGGEARDDGACWIPGEATWRPMSRDGAPSPRSAHAAVWTGRTMLLFGGRDDDGEALADGARYDPQSDRWVELPAGPKPRWDAVLARDARRDLVALWGGAGEALSLGTDDSAWFDASRAAWTSLSTEGAPTLSQGPQVAVGPWGIIALAPTPSRFDLARGRWAPIAGAGAPTHRLSTTAVALPEGALFWGGLDADGPRGDGAIYRVGPDRWEPLPTAGAPTPRSEAVGFWDGAAVRVLWGVDAHGLRDEAFTLRW